MSYLSFAWNSLWKWCYFSDESSNFGRYHRFLALNQTSVRLCVVSMLRARARLFFGQFCEIFLKIGKSFEIVLRHSVHLVHVAFYGLQWKSDSAASEDRPHANLLVPYLSCLCCVKFRFLTLVFIMSSFLRSGCQRYCCAMTRRFSAFIKGVEIICSDASSNGLFTDISLGFSPCKLNKASIPRSGTRAKFYANNGTNKDIWDTNSVSNHVVL